MGLLRRLRDLLTSGRLLATGQCREPAAAGPCDREQQALERILGPVASTSERDLRVIFFLGVFAGRTYVFPEAMPGTVFATVRLFDKKADGSKPNRLGKYELVACTRVTADQAGEFMEMMDHVYHVFTPVLRRSRETVLQPEEVMEIPRSDGEGNTCIVLDEFDTKGVPFEFEGQRHGLLLVIQVHRSEMEYGRQHGGKALLAKLKEAGAYPYSDLGRAPVV